MSDVLEIYLPASSPDNFRFGKVPEAPIVAGNDIFRVKFAKEIWYNPEWRKETMSQISPYLRQTNILIGFSKSGLGALNIAIDNPGLFHSVIIFDSPFMHKGFPLWNTADFYTLATWKKDLAENRLDDIKSLSCNTKIIHIGGANFHRDHEAFHRLLNTHNIPQKYISCPQFAHGWASGWLTENIVSIE